MTTSIIPEMWPVATGGSCSTLRVARTVRGYLAAKAGASLRQSRCMADQSRVAHVILSALSREVEIDPLDVADKSHAPLIFVKADLDAIRDDVPFGALIRPDLDVYSEMLGAVIDALPPFLLIVGDQRPVGFDDFSSAERAGDAALDADPAAVVATVEEVATGCRWTTSLDRS